MLTLPPELMDMLSTASSTSGNSADCLRGGLNGRGTYGRSEAPRPAPPPGRDPPLAPLLSISPGTYVPPRAGLPLRSSALPLPCAYMPLS